MECCLLTCGGDGEDAPIVVCVWQQCGGHAFHHVCSWGSADLLAHLYQVFFCLFFLIATYLVGSFLCFSYRNYQKGIICWDTQFCDFVAGTSVSEPKAASGSLFGLERWCNDGFFPAFGKIRSWNHKIWYISPDSSAFLGNLSWFLALMYYIWVCDPFSFILLYPTLLLYLFYFQYILIQT